MAKKEQKTATEEPKEPQIDWSKYTHTGTETVKSEDLGLPFLVIAQSGSPEVKKTHPNHAEKKIAGCEEGNIFDSLRRVIVAAEEEYVEFIPCAYQKSWIEWKNRKVGSGGFVKAHFDPEVTTHTKRDEHGQDVLPNGNVLVTTAHFFGFYIEDNAGTEIYYPGIVSLSSTQLKKARNWLNLVFNQKSEGNQLPMFAFAYNLSTVPEANEKGSWFGWRIERGRPIKRPELLTQCHDLTKKVITDPARLIGAPQEAEEAY